MTILKIIGIIVLIMIIRFVRDSYKQKDKVIKEGGILKKYSTVINWVLAYPEAKVLHQSNISITVGASNASGSTVFDISQTFGSVTIEYRVNSVLLGNHKLEWEFPEYDDQHKMIEKMENDIEKYLGNVMNNFK
ncbi:MAG: hypothetical protein IJJ77_04765 [Paludibacteraceae bacterium]|nr:hypothetical protein [Paludibacteraceae bacterium]MBR2262684.1 hypothetical protein [Paludibacteraceae bacterium]